MVLFTINPSRSRQLLFKYFHALSGGEEGWDLKQQTFILKKILSSGINAVRTSDPPSRIVRDLSLCASEIHIT
jgi:hypothetical protein